MEQKAPPALLRVLFATAVLSFALSMYLEQRQLDWLQRHPISVDLLSSVVGFATGGLVVAVVFNWIRERHHARLMHEPVAQEWSSAIRSARQAFGLLDSHEAHALGKPEFEAYDRFAAALWSDDPIDPAVWDEHVADMRSESAALLDVADEFAEKYEIDGPKYRTARAKFERTLAAEPESFDAIATELYAFTDTVDRLHYNLMRERLRRQAEPPAATPARRRGVAPALRRPRRRRPTHRTAGHQSGSLRGE
ncbi:hypothetical protein GPX89_42165 [Nocardia sp. ET3-3]|uniref:Uncharacterized protein n=1 Tax=Nocardia terrae TaxID=2675851 RepID=A0A7K1VAY8_9NOCA|nr:hypothetical protein [Nocardia terrae]MVU83823.1 hypothetical protein [Nocardia terrae]